MTPVADTTAGIRTYTAADRDEALDLATNFAREGTYDYFRGQSQLWPLRSSFARRDTTAQKDALEWFLRMRAWGAHQAKLGEDMFSADQATAIAQHYGIPTDFIDVTTSPEVAAFFATPSADGSGTDDLACIYCLQSMKLIEDWKRRHGPFRAPRLVRIDVRNLWRLQAQAGAFLHFPHLAFDDVPGIDRIVFPASREPPLPKERIYPTSKSALEIALDGFFRSETDRTVQKYLKDLPGTEVNVDDPNGHLFRTGLLTRVPEVLPGWNRVHHEGWFNSSAEDFADTVRGRTFDVPDVSPGHLDVAVADLIRARINDNPALRAESVRLSFPPGYDDLSPAQLHTVEDAAERLWDGMRRLPYSPSAIAAAVGSTAALAVASHRTGDLEQAVSALHGPVITVAFQEHHGTHGRSIVAEHEILRRARPDLPSLLARAAEPTAYEALLAIFSPSRLFEFSDFVDLFAHHVLPAQVLRTSPTNPVVFSPASLKTFGLP